MDGSLRHPQRHSPGLTYGMFATKQAFWCRINGVPNGGLEAGEAARACLVDEEPDCLLIEKFICLIVV